MLYKSIALPVELRRQDDRVRRVQAINVPGFKASQPMRFLQALPDKYSSKDDFVNSEKEERGNQESYSSNTIVTISFSVL
jgi:hypothetical protein